MAEMMQIGPWFEKMMQEQFGKTSPWGQAIMWGAGSRQTGVKTPIGKTKLEIIADHIARRARERNMSIPEARDRILAGDLYSMGGLPIPLGAPMTPVPPEQQ